MERNLHNDDFERLLREKSDEFRMYPSKRIWHSIYNNIHPGRKWPSVAMSITLISVLLIMGYLNTRNGNRVYTSTANQAVEATQTSFYSTQKNTDDKQYVIVNDQQAYSDIPQQSNAKHSGKKNKSSHIQIAVSQTSAKNITLSFSAQVKKVTDTEKTAHSARLGVKQQAINEHIVLNNKSITTGSDLNEITANINASDNLTPELLFEDQILPPLQKAAFLNSAALPQSQLTDIDISQNKPVSINDINITSFEKDMLALTKTESIAAEDKEWIENYAMYNKPAKKKWANKLAWQTYAAPSVVYRTLTSNPNFSNTVNTTPFAVSSTTQDINSSVTQTPSVGFELGTGLQYSLLKALKIKVGLQLNYTRYNAHAFQNSHPIATTITMHDLQTNSSYEVYKSTSYANRIGFEATILHNETFQIALPLGADLRLLGNETMQWNIGLSIQPTYVAGGKSYLISSDRHNYVQETSMLRHWNLNAGFETFISYKVNGLTWQVGPQFRSQLFTTNSKKFAVEEKLQSYGLKIGVSKTLK